MKTRVFDPARNPEDRRWLERRVGLPPGSLEPDQPVASVPYDHPLVRHLREVYGDKPFELEYKPE